VQFGLDVLGDGAIPVALLPLAGNTAEARSMCHLLRCDHVPRSRSLSGHTKLDTPENWRRRRRRPAIPGRRLHAAVAGPLPRSASSAQADRVLSQADSKRPAEERDHYQACEVSDASSAPRGPQRARAVPAVVYPQLGQGKQQAATRERHLGKIRAEFEQVEKILGKYSLKTEEAIRRRLDKPAANTAKASCSPTADRDGREVLVDLADRRGRAGTPEGTGRRVRVEDEPVEEETSDATVLASIGARARLRNVSMT